MSNKIHGKARKQHSEMVKELEKVGVQRKKIVKKEQKKKEFYEENKRQAVFAIPNDRESLGTDPSDYSSDYEGMDQEEIDARREQKREERKEKEGRSLLDGGYTLHSVKDGSTVDYQRKDSDEENGDKLGSNQDTPLIKGLEPIHEHEEFKPSNGHLKPPGSGQGNRPGSRQGSPSPNPPRGPSRRTAPCASRASPAPAACPSLQPSSCRTRICTRLKFWRRAASS